MQENTRSIESIFLAALERNSPEERESYLGDACGEDAEFRRKVERLLDAHQKAVDFLELPAGEAVATVDASPIGEGPGTIIDRYKLLQQIGEGGFGVVFMAEQQQPIRRKVALKIIKPGMDTKEVIARFEAEQQALALMDHPNIARVLDAGATESGRPYFVMELVRGIPITEYCDQNNLSPSERIDLFVPLCNAVQHAHQKGIIHRDIKPSNVLITLHDGKPVVKIIDFGISRAINQRLTERTLFTKFDQMIGTPAYMSPEQAEMSGLDVDTRTDIYSLGVLLYELLTGTTPFESSRLREAGYDEIRRIIREEEPPKPSTKISGLGKAITDISSRRKTTPNKLCALVKGDLDWIVMKALEKDRTRRYDTAKELAEDMLRHLRHEPVVARPPSTIYRLRRFARHYRKSLATAGVVLAALAAGAGVALWQWHKGMQSREHLMVAGLVELGRGYEEQGKHADAEKAYRQLLEYQAGARGSDHPDTLKAQYRVAVSLAKQKRLEEAVALLDHSVMTWRRVYGSAAPDTVKAQESLANYLSTAAFQVCSGPSRSASDYARAADMCRRAMDLCPTSTVAHLGLAWAQFRQKDWQSSLVALEESVATQILGGAQWYLFAMNYSGLGDQQGARDWLTFAYEWKFRKPEERKIEFITTMTDDAVALAGLPRGWNPGDLTQEQYVDVYSRLIAKHPRLSWLHHLRGTHHAAIKQFEKAAADYAEAVDCIEAIEPARDDLRHWEALAAVCLYNGDVSRAEATCKRAISRSWSITSTQPLLALMCCYLPSGSLEYDKFYRAVRMAYNNDRATHYISHLRLYTAYRGRGFDEVLTAMQEIGNRPEPELWLFTAMAHERLGSHVLARDALNEARNRIELQEQRSPQVVTSWADKPVHWCQCQALLREAEALIEPGKATSKGQVTGQEKAGTPSSSASAQASKS